MDRRRDTSMRDKVRRRLNEQEASTGAWAVDIPEGRVLEVKENQKDRGISVMNLDFLPYVTSNNPEVKPGELWFRRSYGVHRGVGPDNKTRICLRLTFNKPCPVCEHQAEMYKNAKTEEAKKLASALYRKQRELFNVIDLDDERKGVQVFDTSYHLFGKQLKIELDTAQDYEYDGFMELKGGYTLKCRFNKEVFGESEFFKVTRIDFVKRDDYKEDILKEVFDLDTLFKVLTYEQLEREFLGLDVDEKEETGETERPLRRETKQDKSDEEKEAPMRRSAPKEDDAEQKRMERRKERMKETKGTSDCPHGYEWGVDTDAKEECNRCEKWRECGDDYDARKEAAHAGRK